MWLWKPIRYMMLRARVEDVRVELRPKAKKLLAEMTLLKAGIDPDKNPEILEKTLGKAPEVIVKLSEMPDGFIGKTGEVLAQWRLLQLGIDSIRYSRRRNLDLEAMSRFAEDQVVVPVQVKTCSLRKHGYAIRIDKKPLDEFDGWYIAVLEREPWDDFLYITSGRMRILMNEYGDQPEKSDKAAKHHRERFYLPVYRCWEVLRHYLDPSEFVTAVTKNGD